MSRLLIVEPMAIAGISASRGTGATNLTTPDPKEVWADTGLSNVALTVDLGAPRPIDTIFLGYLSNSSASGLWFVSGGVTEPGQFVVMPNAQLRVPDVAGHTALRSHALHCGTVVTVRYLTIVLNQPEGVPLTAGVLVIGRAFIAELGQEWGAGRQVIDTGTATALPSGGFSMVEGVRKRRFSWTFGDLSRDEADRLELIALALGETKPGLVVEDDARTAGLVARIRYGKFERWKPFERRNRRQTRWEVAIEDWS